MIIVLFVLSVIGAWSEEVPQCNLLPGKTINSQDVAPSQFVVSSYDCCNKCNEIDNCVAGVYNMTEYKCHFKGTASFQNAGSDAVVVQPNKPTPAPTPVPTPKPPPPPPRPGMLATVTACSYGPYCRIAENQNCITEAYVEGDCISFMSDANELRSREAKCLSEGVLVKEYAGKTCSGQYTSQLIPHECTDNGNLVYHGSACTAVTVSPPSVYVAFTECYGYGCNPDGLGCSGNAVSTGTCTAGQPPWQPFEAPSLNAANQSAAYIATQYNGWITFTQYNNQDCGGVAQGVPFAVPSNVCFPYMEDYSQQYNVSQS